MTKRWFNYRPICITFLFLLLGTLFAFYLKEHVIIATTICFIMFVLILILALNKNRIRYFLIPLISFVIGISSYFISVSTFSKTIDEAPKIVETRIYAISNVKNGSITVKGDTCVFDGIEQKDDITIIIYDNSSLFENVEIGNTIRFAPNKIFVKDLFENDLPDAKAFSENNKYVMSTSIENLESVKENKTLAERIKLQIKTNLNKGLSNENADIAYSSLFGDKEFLNKEQYESYQLSGVAHLLAVSGLHVGIITAILYKIFDWCKVKNLFKFILVGIVLFCYAYICGFSISVVRASIMAMILMLSNILNREYDTLNSLSVAGIIIFAINPLCSFDVSFLMSFSCIMGISMLMGPIKNGLIKLKMKKRIAEPLAISLSTSITLMFIMAYFFNRVNIISVFANLIIIPLFTIAFTVIFICAFVSLIFPAITILLNPFNYLLSFISILSLLFAKVPGANFAVSPLPFVSILIYFAFLLIVSRFCVAKYKEKFIVGLPLFALLLVCLL